jgi:hypothetical protein
MVTVDDLHKDVEKIRPTLNSTPSVWGPAIWKLLHDTIEIIPCKTCKEEGRIMMEGLHDIINVYKGERPERPSSLCELYTQVKGAVDRVGLCPLEAEEQQVFE